MWARSSSTSAKARRCSRCTRTKASRMSSRPRASRTCTRWDRSRKAVSALLLLLRKLLRVAQRRPRGRVQPRRHLCLELDHRPSLVTRSEAQRDDCCISFRAQRLWPGSYATRVVAQTQGPPSHSIAKPALASTRLSRPQASEHGKLSSVLLAEELHRRRGTRVPDTRRRRAQTQPGGAPASNEHDVKSCKDKKACRLATQRPYKIFKVVHVDAPRRVRAR